MHARQSLGWDTTCLCKLLKEINLGGNQTGIKLVSVFIILFKSKLNSLHKSTYFLETQNYSRMYHHEVTIDKK